jgi:hypothetical protein
MAKSKPIPSGPDYDKLVAIQASMSDAVSRASKLEQCGYDCQQFRDQINQIDQTVRKMLSVYYPNGKPSQLP